MEQLAAVWGSVGGGPSPRRRRVSRPFPAPPVPPSPQRLSADLPPLPAVQTHSEGSPRRSRLSMPIRPRSATGHHGHKHADSGASGGGDTGPVTPTRPASAAAVRPSLPNFPFRRGRASNGDNNDEDIEVLRKTPLPNIMRRLTRRRSEAGLPRVPVGYEYVVEAAVPPPPTPTKTSTAQGAEVPIIGTVVPAALATPASAPPSTMAPPDILEPAPTIESAPATTPTPGPGAQAQAAITPGPSSAEPAHRPNLGLGLPSSRAPSRTHSHTDARAPSPVPSSGPAPTPTSETGSGTGTLVQPSAARVRPRPSLPAIITDINPRARRGSLAHVAHVSIPGITPVTAPPGAPPPGALTAAQLEAASYRERVGSTVSRDDAEAKTPKTPRTAGFFRSLSHRPSVRVFSGRSKSKAKKSKNGGSGVVPPLPSPPAPTAESGHGLGRTILRKASRTSLRHQLSSKSLRRTAETDGLAPPVPAIPSTLLRRGATPEPRATSAGSHYRQSKYDLPPIPPTLGRGDDPFAVAAPRPPTLVEPSHTYHAVLSPEHSPTVSHIHAATSAPSPAKSFNAAWKMATSGDTSASSAVDGSGQENDTLEQAETHEVQGQAETGAITDNAPVTPTIKVSRTETPENASNASNSSNADIPSTTGTDVRSAAKDESTLLPPQNAGLVTPLPMPKPSDDDPETPTKKVLPEANGDASPKGVSLPSETPRASLCAPSLATPGETPQATPKRSGSASHASSVNGSPLDRFTPDDDFSPHDGSFLPRMEPYDGHSLSTIYEVASSTSMRSVASFFLHSHRHTKSATGQTGTTGATATPVKNRGQADMLRRMSLVSNGSPMRNSVDGSGLQARLIELYEENLRLKERLDERLHAREQALEIADVTIGDVTMSEAVTPRPHATDLSRDQTTVLSTAAMNWREHAQEMDTMFQAVKAMALEAMAAPSAKRAYNEGVQTSIAAAVNSLEVAERVGRDVHGALYAQLLDVAADFCRNLPSHGHMLAAMACVLADPERIDDDRLDTPDGISEERLASALVKLATANAGQTTYYETAKLYLQSVVLQSQVAEMREQRDTVLLDNQRLAAELEKVQRQYNGLLKTYDRHKRESEAKEDELFSEIEELEGRARDLEIECQKHRAISTQTKSATRSLIRQSLRDLSSILPDTSAGEALPMPVDSTSFGDMLLEELTKRAADESKATELAHLRDEYNEQADELGRLRRQTEATINKLQVDKEEVYRELVALKSDYKFALEDKEACSMIATSLKSRNESLHAKLEQLTLANVQQRERIRDLEKRSSDDTLELVALQKREEALHADCDELRTALSSVQLELELAKNSSTKTKTTASTPLRPAVGTRKAASTPFTPSKTVPRVASSPTKAKQPARDPQGASASLPRRGKPPRKPLTLRASTDGLRRASGWTATHSGPASAGPTTTHTPTTNATTVTPRRRPVSAVPMLRVTSATSAEPGSSPNSPDITPPTTPPHTPPEVCAELETDAQAGPPVNPQNSDRDTV